MQVAVEIFFLLLPEPPTKSLMVCPLVLYLAYLYIPASDRYLSSSLRHPRIMEGQTSIRYIKIIATSIHVILEVE